MSPLPTPILAISTLLTLLTLLISTLSIHSHLRSYRQPHLQRHVVRIMLMVPLYAASSLVSMWSVRAAFFIDVVRDVYEAFVIYSFFHLLLAYLGGDRALLHILHGRPPKHYLFPISLFKRECDVSDPFVFLAIRRGIFQYVQIKPLLALATLILRATGTYHEGTFRPTDGYLYISIIYNTSICVSLYCLAMFWVVVHEDIKPFRPVPKFLCVKGVIFFSFWQSIFISILAASGAISRLGDTSDAPLIALALNDTLITLEMPLFALAHFYAFASSDYASLGTRIRLVGRMPVLYALRDAFGGRDVLVDARATMSGAMSYRAYEPAEGGMHLGEARERRIRAGLRYAQGGRRKYWLPVVREDGVGKRGEEREGYAPLMGAQAGGVVHDAETGEPVLPSSAADVWGEEEWERTTLGFSDVVEDGVDESAYAKARLLEFGDGNYPVVDCSDEQARRWMREVERGIVSGRVSAVGRGVWERERLLSEPGGGGGYGALGGEGGERRGIGERTMSLDGQAGGGKGKTPPRRGRDPHSSGTATPAASSSSAAGGGVYGAWAEIVPPVPPPLDPPPPAQPAKPTYVVDMAPAPVDLTIGPGVQLGLAHKGHGGAGVARGGNARGGGGVPEGRGRGVALPADAVDLAPSSPSSTRAVYRQGVGEGAEARVELRDGRADVQVRGGGEGRGVEARVGGVGVVRAESPPERVRVLVRELGEGENPWAEF